MTKRELEERLRRQDQLLEQLGAIVAKLAPLASAPPALPAPPPSAADPGPTIDSLWRRYDKFQSGLKWWRTVGYQMKAAIAHFGPILASDIRKSHWVEYRDQRSSAITQMGRPPTDGTLNLELKRLKAMCNWALAEELIARNPFVGIKLKKTTKRRTRFTEDDLQALLRIAPPWYRVALLLSLDCGMRQGEIIHLEWTEIDLSLGLYSLPASKTKTRTARKGFLTDRAIDAIRLVPRRLGCPYVIPNALGKPYSGGRVREIWRQLRAEAGLTAAPGDGLPHFHDGRHHATSNMVSEGANPIAAMRAVGHETIAQHADYAHLDDGDLLDLKERMDQAILRGPRRGPRRASLSASQSTTVANKIGSEP